MKKQLGFLFFIFGLTGVLLSGISITGAVIGNFRANLISIFYLGFILVGILMFVSNQDLDTILIPTGGKENKRRTVRAYQEYFSQKGKPEILVSGIIPPRSVQELQDQSYEPRQTKQIVDNLVEHGVDPTKISIEGLSENSLQNLLYSSDIFKKENTKNVGISTDKSQYARFKRFERQGKQEGLIPKDLHLHHLEIDSGGRTVIERLKHGIYYLLSRPLDWNRMRRGFRSEKGKKKSSENKYVEAVKTALWS
jgi:uncharacterized SAM-binding protein YcdF (DUF218 family)